MRSKAKSVDEEIVRMKKSENRKSCELSAKALKEVAKRKSLSRQLDRDKSASESDDDEPSQKSKPKKVEKKRFDSGSDFEVELKTKSVAKKCETSSKENLPEKKITKAKSKPQGIQYCIVLFFNH